MRGREKVRKGWGKERGPRRSSGIAGKGRGLMRAAGYGVGNG